MDERDTFEPARSRSRQQPPDPAPYAPQFQTARHRRAYGLPVLIASTLAAVGVGAAAGYAAFHKHTTTPPATAGTPGPTAAAATFMLHGTLTLTLGAFENDGATCKGYTGYTDIDAGTPATVADQTGKTIAVGHLDSGTPQGTAERATSCVLAFNIQVPDGQPFYAVTVSHRGTQTVSADQARRPLALTLGNP